MLESLLERKHALLKNPLHHCRYLNAIAMTSVYIIVQSIVTEKNQNIHTTVLVIVYVVRK